MNWHRLVVLYNMKREQESTKTRVYTTLSLCRKLCLCVCVWQKIRCFDLVYSHIDFLRVYPRSVRAYSDIYPVWEGIKRTSGAGGEVYTYRACRRIKTLHARHIIIRFCVIISRLHYLQSLGLWTRLCPQQFTVYQFYFQFKRRTW